MERKVVIMCAVIGFLGLLSVILGFAAEASRINPDKAYVDDNLNIICPPKSSATGLGILALLAILLSEIITSVATGCICSCKGGPQPTSCNWTVAQVFFILSWFTVILAVILLTVASIENNSVNENAFIPCPVADPGVFASGAVFSLVTVVLGLV